MYNLYIVNDDLSKTFIQSFDSNSYTYEQIMIEVGQMDQSKTYSIELWDGRDASVLL